MTVWILYSRFTDDPSTIRGIFTNKDKMLKEFEEWTDDYKDWVEIELDKIYDHLVLN